MMFGIPAIALAIYKTAREDRKKEVKGVMTAGAVTAFASTVTEPIEFSFLFASPKLYLLHSFYTALLPLWRQGVDGDSGGNRILLPVLHYL